MMVIEKYILAALLAALPFICTHAFEKEEETAGGTYVHKHSLACLLATYLHQIPHLRLAIGHFFARLYDRMRKSDNSRKFYNFILLIVLLVYTNVDFSAAESVRNILNSTGSPTGGAAVQAAVYSPMEYDMLVLFMCLLFTPILFQCGILDKILKWIVVCWYFITFTKCLSWAVVAIVDSSWFIMAEVETICLMAALYYPVRISEVIRRDGYLFPSSSVSRRYFKRRREQNTVWADYPSCRQNNATETKK